LQPPNVVQIEIERLLVTQLAILPAALFASCKFALRKFFCSQFMAKPQEQLIQNVFLNSLKDDKGKPYTLAYLTTLLGLAGINAKLLLPYSFYLPSEPYIDICTDYENKCAGFITVANSAGITALNANCSAHVLPGVLQFPKADQTFIALLVPIINQEVKFRTSPNFLATSIDTTGYEVSCPYLFVILDAHANWNKFTRMIPGLACSFPCK
jgi:hypothetical protein